MYNRVCKRLIIKRKVIDKLKNIIIRVLLYVLGVFLVGLSVTILLRANLGSGSWDAVNANFNILTKDRVTVGTASMIVGFTFLLIILLYRKKTSYLVSLIPILITGFVIDLWNLIILKNFIVTETYLKILLLMTSLVILPFALSIMMLSGFASMVFDETTLILMEVLKIKSFAKVRLLLEGFGVLIAIIFGLIAGGQLYEVSYATIVISLLIGPLINMWINIYKKYDINFLSKDK